MNRFSSARQNGKAFTAENAGHARSSGGLADCQSADASAYSFAQQTVFTSRILSSVVHT